MPDKSTPTPWRRGQSGNLHIYGPDGMGKHSGLVATVSGRFYDGERAANTALIVRAVNHFEELVDVLKLVRKTCGGPENWNGETRRFLEATDAILAKVKEAGHG